MTRICPIALGNCACLDRTRFLCHGAQGNRMAVSDVEPILSPWPHAWNLNNEFQFSTICFGVRWFSSAAPIYVLFSPRASLCLLIALSAPSRQDTVDSESAQRIITLELRALSLL